MPNQYSELHLGPTSEQAFIRQVATALGFDFSGQQQMRGKSGLLHEIDGVGIRERNALLILSGAKDLEHIDKRYADLSPRDKVEIWSRDALLRMYDVAAVLELEGLNVDLMYFQNSLTRNVPFAFSPAESIEYRDWVATNNLPKDMCGFWQTSIDSIATPAPRYLSDIATSIGACHVGLAGR